MAQHHSVRVKLSNLQLNKLKNTTKNSNYVTLRLSSNMIGTNETSFPHNLLLTDRKVSRSFANNSSGNFEFQKNQISKIIQSGEFLGRLLEPSMKVGLSLMKNALASLTKVC